MTSALLSLESPELPRHPCGARERQGTAPLSLGLDIAALSLQ